MTDNRQPFARVDRAGGLLGTAEKAPLATAARLPLLSAESRGRDKLVNDWLI